MSDNGFTNLTMKVRLGPAASRTKNKLLNDGYSGKGLRYVTLHVVMTTKRAHCTSGEIALVEKLCIKDVRLGLGPRPMIHELLFDILLERHCSCTRHPIGITIWNCRDKN